MVGVYAVKLLKSDGEAIVTANGEEYRITIADLEASAIQDGDVVEEIGLIFLTEASEKLACIKKAFVYLSYRALPTRKLEQKLKQAGFSETAIEKSIPLLIKKGYLNDDELCFEYACALRDSKLFGASRLRKELYAKGFKRETIETALDAVYADYDIETAVVSAINKKFSDFDKEDRLQRAKVVAYLYRLGYSYDDINNAISAFEKE